MPKNSPIGVFDSGLGGISVLREMVSILPNEDYIYFGDSINAPYGVKTKSEVNDLTIGHVENLLNMGCKAICIACNTATSAAVANLRRIYPELPLVGIEPAIKPAIESMDNPRVLVMATPMTIREEKFHNLLSRFEDQGEIIKLPCPGLMEFIENGILTGSKLNSFLKQILWDYIGKVDCAVLGCTHYPFVKKEIQKVLGENVKLFDGSLGTARELKRRIEVAGLLNDVTTPPVDEGPDKPPTLRITMLNSDPSHIELANKLLYS